MLVGRGIVGTDIDAAVPDGLAVLLGLLGEAEDTSDHEGPGDLGTSRLDVLDRQSQRGECVGHLFGTDPLGKVHQLAQP